MAARPTRPEGADYISAVNQLTQIITDTRPYLRMGFHPNASRMWTEIDEFLERFQVGLFLTIEYDLGRPPRGKGNIPNAGVMQYFGPGSALSYIPEYLDEFLQALPHVPRTSMLEDGNVPRCPICWGPFAEEFSPAPPTNNEEKNQSDNNMVLPAEAAIESQTVDIPVRLPCGHVFGEDCLRSWLSNLESWNPPTCPICRCQLEGLGDVILVSNGDFYEETITVPPPATYSGSVGERLWNGVWTGVWREDLFL